MSLDAFSTLDSLRDFLSGQVLNAVPPDLRSELRAATKLLDDVKHELDALPDQVVRETKRLLTLCAGVLRLLPAQRADSITSLHEHCVMLAARLGSGEPLRDRVATHLEVQKLSAAVLLEALHQREALRADDARRNELNAAICDFLRELRAQAAARQPWQSVFPRST